MGNRCSRGVIVLSGRWATVRDPESCGQREPGRYALAELHRLSALAPEVLRADRICSCLVPELTTRTPGAIADRILQSCSEKRPQSGRLRRVAVGRANSCAARISQYLSCGAF